MQSSCRVYLLLIVFQVVSSGFIHREDTHFVLDGKKFYYGGANAYNLFTKSPQEIDSRMAEMSSNGVRVLRTWGFSHEDWHGNHSLLL